MVILFGTAVYVHRFGLLFTFGLMVFLTVNEYIAMVKPGNRMIFPSIIAVIVYLMVFATTWLIGVQHFLIFLGVVCFYHILILIELLLVKSGRPLRTYGPGVLYLALAASSIHYFQYDSKYQKDLFILLALVWASDTGSYFVGRYFGKTPLAPSISPSKTREGFFGGFLLGFLFSSVLILFHVIDWKLYVVALVVHILVVLGDLIESKLKRLTLVKDSSHLIPGHGGFLDRCDGLLFAMPFAILLYHYFFKI
jgi:phosphatidate cytidylyltransferase